MKLIFSKQTKRSHSMIYLETKKKQGIQLNKVLAIIYYIVEIGKLIIENTGGTV